jgi:hypothetical protein
VFPLLRHNRTAIFLLLAGLGSFCALAGCQSLPRSGFDPTGQRLFESNPFSNCPLFNRGSESGPTTVNSTPPIDSFQPEGASIYTPPPSALPGDFGASRTNPAVPQYGSTATTLPPGASAVTTALIHNPNAGPTRIFAETGGYALPTVPVSGPAVIMTPREQIAPLGSEVVLIASYLGNKEHLITNEKIEWSLDGIGTIEEFDAGSCYDIFHFDCLKAKKVTDRYAITKTSSILQTLDRGTPDTTDDIHLLRGQTWVSVNSMKEGTTHVTAFAPNMADWSKRTDVGIVHWVDAQWVLPQLAIAPIGESRVLTTTVRRATNGQSRKGWVVRYEILNGPAAGLGASGAQVEEIETDLSGQATTIITPRDQRAGTNTIGIQIIRPQGIDSDHRITVGSETVRQTWAGNPDIWLDVQGPTKADPGADLPYVITADNKTSSPIKGVVVLPISPLASLIRSEPAGTLTDSTLWWDVDLAPQSTARFNVVLRQGSRGSLWVRPEFHRRSPVVTQTPAPPSPSPGGALVYPGVQTPPTPPPTPLPPSNPPTPPASVFAPQSTPTLSVQIVPITSPIEQGKPVQFYVHVKNSGTTDARNIMLLIPLPAELRDVTIMSDWNTEWGHLAVGDRKHSPIGKPSDWRAGLTPDGSQALLQASVLAPDKEFFFLLEYPTIEQQGYNITCTVYANDEPVANGARLIAP